MLGWCFKTVAYFCHLCAFCSASVQWRMRKPVSNWLWPLCHQHVPQTESDAQSCLERSLEKPCSPHTWILPQPRLFEELTALVLWPQRCRDVKAKGSLGIPRALTLLPPDLAPPWCLFFSGISRKSRVSKSTGCAGCQDNSPILGHGKYDASS